MAGKATITLNEITGRIDGLSGIGGCQTTATVSVTPKPENMLVDLTGKKSIEFVKHWKHQNEGSEIVDAILAHISGLETAENLVFSDNYMVGNKRVIVIEEGIMCQLLEVVRGPDGVMTMVRLVVFSDVLGLEDLKEWTDGIWKKYHLDQQHKLETNRFFFDEKLVPPPVDMQTGGYNLKQAEKVMTFTMTPFKTYKSLENIYGKQVNEIRERVRHFVDNKDWYRKRGIPYTLGLLLHGPPGCGKTSAIKAIAKDTNRHIVNVALRKYTTQTQLWNLFFDPKITVEGMDGKIEKVEVPLDERIYVMEDIDCLSEIVWDREMVADMKKKEDAAEDERQKERRMARARRIQEMNGAGGRTGGGGLDSQFGLLGGGGGGMNDDVMEKAEKLARESGESQALNLGFLLNLLDGVLEVPGRIVIMTSNYPEKLDRALVRPGRIDLTVKFDRCDVSMLREMFQNFFELSDKGMRKYEFKDREGLNKKFTPAEVVSVLCTNYNNPDRAFDCIIGGAQLEK